MIRTRLSSQSLWSSHGEGSYASDTWLTLIPKLLGDCMLENRLNDPEESPIWIVHRLSLPNEQIWSCLSATSPGEGTSRLSTKTCKWPRTGLAKLSLRSIVTRAT